MADLEERLRITDHNPRWPLGCPVSWGPRLNFGSTSGGLHCCRERRTAIIVGAFESGRTPGDER